MNVNKKYIFLRILTVIMCLSFLLPYNNSKSEENTQSITLSSNVEIILENFTDDSFDSVTFSSTKEKPIILPQGNYYDINEILNYEGLAENSEYVVYSYLKEIQKDGTYKTIKVLEKTFQVFDSNSFTTLTFYFAKLEDNKKYVIHDYLIPSPEETEENNDTNRDIDFRVAFENPGDEIAENEAETILKSSKIKYSHETVEGDFSQTIVVDPSTIATAVAYGEKIADGVNILTVPYETTTLKDIVSYKNLIPNLEYYVQGAIVDYDNYSKLTPDILEKLDPFISPNELTDADRKEYQKYIIAVSDKHVFNAKDNGSGTQEVIFNNIKLEKNKRYVIFEKIESTKLIMPYFPPNINPDDINYNNEYLKTTHLLTHMDIKDLKQTFTTYDKLLSINVTKTWIDSNNKYNKRPNSITVRLYANGVEKMSKNITSSDNWKCSFENLMKYEDDKEILYTISEDKVNNYKSEVNGYNITNTYIAKSVPKTGDTMSFALYIALILFAIVSYKFIYHKKEID